MLRALAILALPATLAACSCTTPNACQLIDRAAAIFVGEVVDGGLTTSQNPWETLVPSATFRVLETIHGLPKGARTVTLKIHQIAGMCAPNPYVQGRRFLVGANRDTRTGELYDGGCFLGQEAASAAGELALLRTHFASPNKPFLSGRVTLGEGKDAPPAAGATIHAVEWEDSFSTTTGPDGAYFLAVPRPGVYFVDAQLPPHPLSPNLMVRILRGACGIANLSITPSSPANASALEK